MNPPNAAVPHLGHGVGLRVRHYGRFLDGARPDVDFFEAITENFLAPGGRPRAVLDTLVRRVPLVFHGVGLGIGSTTPPPDGYLRAARELFDRYDPPWVSDHLCFTRAEAHHTHDLLPIPYCRESLDLVCRNVERVRKALGGRPFCLENISRYVRYRHDTMDEAAFLAEVVRRTGCGILLDVNNLLVCRKNLGEDPVAYLARLPRGSVYQYHLANHTDRTTHAIDDHRGPVPAEVLDLYVEALSQVGPAATVVEWDEDVPDWETLAAQARRAAAAEDRARAP